MVWKINCLFLLFLFCISCINRNDEKAVLLGKKLEAVSILSTASDSLLCEMKSLSPYQYAKLLIRISSDTELVPVEIEKLEPLLLDALTFTSKKEKRNILQRLIFIYQRWEQFGSLNAPSKGLKLCEELINNYSLSKEEIWNIKRTQVSFLNKQGAYKESITVQYNLLQEHRDANKAVYIVQDLIEIANFFIRLDDTEKGLSLLKETYHQAKTEGLSEQQFVCLSSIIDASFELRRYKDVINICDSIYLDSIKNVPSIYLMLSKSYLQLQKTDSARFYLTQMIQNLGQGSGLIFNCRMAETYILENREDSADFYLNKAVESWKTVGESREKIRKKLPLYFMYVYPSYASLLEKNGKIKQASEAFQFVEPLMRTPVSEPERMEKQMDALGHYSDFCRSTKQYAKAAELLVYRDSIQKLYYENKISLDSKHWVDRFEIQELTYTTDKQRDEINNAKRMLAIIIAASVIVLCISAIAFYLYVKYRKQNMELRELKMQEIQAVQLANSQTNLPKKREPLTPQEKLYNAAKKLVESQKLYLNDALTLDELAEKLDTNRSTLSACINQCSKSNFNQWINNYRIDYIQKCITANSDLDLRKLCSEAGFHSYNTFNNSFKDRLGCTPKEYIKKHKYDDLQEETDEPLA